MFLVALLGCMGHCRFDILFLCYAGNFIFSFGLMGEGKKYKIVFMYIVLIRLSPKGLVLPFRRLFE